jgi:peptidoglycan-associated lipoprotein
MQARWLQQHDGYNFTIEGHGDDPGTPKQNEALGLKRALVVQAYLASENISESRMTTLSHGYTQRVATCKDETCWSQNRRTQTVLTVPAIKP